MRRILPESGRPGGLVRALDRPTSAQIREFWRWFKEHEARLGRVLPGKAVDLVCDQLQKLSRGLYCELTVAPSSSELVVTADGQVDLFPLVRAICAAAPRLPGWAIIALKQPQGFDFRYRGDGRQYKAAELRFEFLERADDPEALGLRVFLPPPLPEASEAATIVWRILETGLGERQAHRQFQHVEAARSGKSDAEFPALKTLAHFIAWRRTRKARS